MSRKNKKRIKSAPSNQSTPPQISKPILGQLPFESSPRPPRGRRIAQLALSTIGLFGSLGTIYQLRPTLKLTPAVSSGGLSPHALHHFTISNDGYLPVRDVEAYCYENQISVEVTGAKEV